MTHQQRVAATQQRLESPRFANILRLYSARDVVEQQGTINSDYTVAREAAEAFFLRLRELFARRRSITTFGPYSPGQAVTMKRIGIEGIYLGGWATSAKGSLAEDPGPDLASYPLGQVPDEAASLVRALLTADKNQQFDRLRMTDEQRAAAPVIDYRPFIIADADTGHGGDAHVRNLIRRFVEVGVPGYHIEDQRPGAKKCGHQAGKVLVSQDEQIKRLNAARLQLDIMGVPGIIVARTDAEAATFLDNRSDERDQPFILGATRTDLPSYKAGYLGIMRTLADAGVESSRGHLLFAVSDTEYRAVFDWYDSVGLTTAIAETAQQIAGAPHDVAEAAREALDNRYMETWQASAGLKTYAQAVADAMTAGVADGQQFEMTPDAFLQFVQRASFFEVTDRARALGVSVTWDCELPKTPEGFYQIQGGIDYAIAKSLGVAPFADVLWMETKTADLEDARTFAKAIHAQYPDKMLAYNLSPSFNWDTTGMSDEEMKRFPEELGTLGFVFNFITYGGHQIDGLAAEEFATALKDDGMLALARLQRKFRLLQSPYGTPQALVGGPRLDGALMAVSARTAATKAMGKGSTHAQHLVQTEVPMKLLEDWLQTWATHHSYPGAITVRLRPHIAGSEWLDLSVKNEKGETMADVLFQMIQDRRGRAILTIRDQNTTPELRQRRLMTLLQLFLIRRYRAASVHYLTPNEMNDTQVQRMTTRGIFAEVKAQSGQIIVADVHAAILEGDIPTPAEIERRLADAAEG